jgi:hypothetical protein
VHFAQRYLTGGPGEAGLNSFANLATAERHCKGVEHVPAGGSEVVRNPVVLQCCMHEQSCRSKLRDTCSVWRARCPIFGSSVQAAECRVQGSPIGGSRSGGMGLTAPLLVGPGLESAQKQGFRRQAKKVALLNRGSAIFAKKSEKEVPDGRKFDLPSEARSRNGRIFSWLAEGCTPINFLLSNGPLLRHAVCTCSVARSSGNALQRRRTRARPAAPKSSATLHGPSRNARTDMSLQRFAGYLQCLAGPICEFWASVQAAECRVQGSPIGGSRSGGWV